jgi:hypothetical protein
MILDQLNPNLPRPVIIFVDILLALHLFAVIFYFISLARSFTKQKTTKSD